MYQGTSGENGGTDLQKEVTSRERDREGEREGRIGQYKNSNVGDFSYKAHGDVTTLGHSFSNYVHCCLIGPWTLEETAIPSLGGWRGKIREAEEGGQEEGDEWGR
jgi:hypothetical protein